MKNVYCDCIIDFILHNRQISNAKKTTIIKFYLWIGVFREIVFLGTQEFVEQTRENIREEVMTFIRKMNMDAYITVAADAFIMPNNFC